MLFGFAVFIGLNLIDRSLRRRLPRSHSGTIDFSLLFKPRLLGLVSLSSSPFRMAGNLTAILPLEDFSFPGLADVSYVKLLTALVAFPAVVVILHVFSQLVCALRLPLVDFI